jgi:predicted SAM-dependent methyltransferase
MKLSKRSWIGIPLVIVVGVLLGRLLGGGLERAFRNSTVRDSTVLSIAAPVANTWDAVRTAALRTYRTRIKDPGTIRDYLKSHTVRKLQIGAGANDPEGWLNSDIEPSSKEIYLDATGRYPFPDGSFQYVLSEHVIEHVPWEGGVAMLRECHRVLAPGGKVRTVTPNLTKFVQLVGGATGAVDRQFIDAKLRIHGWPVTPVPEVYILNREVRDWGHQFLYDPATLRKSLELAGFQRIKEYPVGEKTDPVFQEAELRTRYPGSDLWVINNWEAMAIEATR